MSAVNLTEIKVLQNRAARERTCLSAAAAPFAAPYVFKITFECIAPLSDGASWRKLALRWTDIEWKLIYVGSAENESYDQELDTCMVGPVPVGSLRIHLAELILAGVNSFEFEARVCLRLD